MSKSFRMFPHLKNAKERSTSRSGVDADGIKWTVKPTISFPAGVATVENDTIAEACRAGCDTKGVVKYNDETKDSYSGKGFAGDEAYGIARGLLTGQEEETETKKSGKGKRPSVDAESQVNGVPA